MSQTLTKRRQVLLDLTKNKSPIWREKSLEEWDAYAAKCWQEFYPDWCLSLITGNHKTPYTTLLQEGMVPEWVHRLKMREVDNFLYEPEAKAFDEMMIMEWLETDDGAREFDEMFNEKSRRIEFWNRQAELSGADDEFDSMFVDARINS